MTLERYNMLVCLLVLGCAAGIVRAEEPAQATEAALATGRVQSNAPVEVSIDAGGAPSSKTNQESSEGTDGTKEQSGDLRAKLRQRLETQDSSHRAVGGEVDNAKAHAPDRGAVIGDVQLGAGAGAAQLAQDEGPVSQAESPAAAARSRFANTRLRDSFANVDSAAGDRGQDAWVSFGKGWMLNTLGALGVVLGLIFIGRWLLLKGRGASLGLGASGQAGVEVLSRTSIGLKTTVLLLRVHQRVYIVGQTPTGLQTIGEINDPEEAAAMIGARQQQSDRSLTNAFRSTLKSMESDYEPGQARRIEDGADESEQYVDRARDQLASLAGRIRTMGKRVG